MRPDERLDLAVAVSWADGLEAGDAAFQAELARWVRPDAGTAGEGVSTTAVPHVPAGQPRHTEVPVRDFEVVIGLELARARRPSARKDVDLARGPARLATALALTGAENGRDFCDGGGLRMLTGEPIAPSRLRSGPRVGVAPAGAASPWRWWLEGEPSVSVYRPAKPRRRRS